MKYFQLIRTITLQRVMNALVASRIYSETIGCRWHCVFGAPKFKCYVPSVYLVMGQLPRSSVKFRMLMMRLVDRRILS